MIGLEGFRVKLVELGELATDSIPSNKTEAMMSLSRRVEIKPDDNKRARIFLRSELTMSKVKLIMVSETRFRNPEGFTNESINSEETLKNLINIIWPRHLEIIKFLTKKAGYQIVGLPETIDKLEG